MLIRAFKSIVLISLPNFALLIPDNCFSSEIRNEARDCTNRLSPMLDNLKSVLAGTRKSSNLIKDITDFCDFSLKCYKTLQLCSGIDPNLITNLDGVCDMYSFKAKKFDGCYQKMTTSIEDNCVYSFFMTPVYINIPDKKQRCETLKSNGKCVQKKTESVCSKNYSKEFHDQLDDQLKRFLC
ncbi:T20D4.11-like domain-containing protein [Caenorhabditis elegans]|uniref:T20D4.11-like domain-containing protein n=1 Tax=Caenorhabditis elegans TaxID=6239 RepID=A5JYW7_CAEEL|nr:DUF19 domain-containing protein [Caenorhabditis elegans]CAN86583.1 DUF19 domain-containing protein [Caenorhabditis elegans]|eukprot:NP_001122897.1 Uncharacterized protein CELE_D1086.18 [Caenorhabditis elegans]